MGGTRRKERWLREVDGDIEKLVDGSLAKVPAISEVSETITVGIVIQDVGQRVVLVPTLTEREWGSGWHALQEESVAGELTSSSAGILYITTKKKEKGSLVQFRL